MSYVVQRFLAALLITLMAPAAGLAADRGVSVPDRARPAYDPLGITAGAFTIFPEVTVGTEYNDNIYATRSNKESDWIFTVAPRIRAGSDWSNHAVNMDAGIKSGFYASESDENYVDGHLLANGRLDISRDSSLSARAGIRRLHEDRGEPDVDRQAFSWDEPGIYYRTIAGLDFYQAFGRFGATLGGGYTNLDYKSVDLIDGTSQDRDIQDREIYTVTGRLQYDMHPDVKPFITTRYEWRDYDQSEAERDSEGYRIGVGTGFDLGGITSGEVYGGYMKQDYDDRSNISGFWFGLSKLWNATPITSVEAFAETSVKETTLQDSSGIRSFDLGLRADHELRRNVLIGAAANYTLNDYRGADLTEDYYAVGPSLTYLWNRNLSAEIGYRYRTKDSDIRDREYSENRFTVAITGSL